MENSKGMEWINKCLAEKGSSPRENINTLIFLAPDERNLENLLDALAEKKAWQFIKDEKLLFNLTANQEVQADQKIQQATNTINLRIPETWCHLISPHQEQPGINNITMGKQHRSFKKDMDLLSEAYGAMMGGAHMSMGGLAQQAADHMSDEDGRIDTEKAKNVHKFLQDTFPNSVQDLKVYEVKTSDPVWQEKAKKMFMK